MKILYRLINALKYDIDSEVIQRWLRKLVNRATLVH